MKSITYGVIGLFVLFFMILPAYAGENPAQEVASKCKVELEKFCQDVTPGKGRIIACLYAYSDRLSEQCRNVVRDTFQELKMISAVSDHLKDECGDDVEKFCKNVTPGEGRILSCLEKNDHKLSSKCKTALKEVGLKD